MVESLQTVVHALYSCRASINSDETLTRTYLSQMEGNWVAAAIYTIGAVGTTMLLIASRS